MARKRMIEPGMWNDDGFLSLSIPARLLWVGLISHADDEGRGSASPKALKAKVFPGDAMTDEAILALRAEVATYMRVAFYRADPYPDEYYQLQRWNNHQSIKDKRESTVPPPERGDTSPEPPRNLPGTSPTPERERGKLPSFLPSPTPRRKKSREEKRERAAGVTLTDGEMAALETKHTPELVAEAVEYLSAYKQTHGKRYVSDAGALRQFGIQAALERRAKNGAPAAKPKREDPRCPRCKRVITFGTSVSARCVCGAVWERQADGTLRDALEDEAEPDFGPATPKEAQA